MFTNIMKTGPTWLCLDCSQQPVFNDGFGGVWQIDTDGVRTLWETVGQYAPNAKAGDEVLLWGEITETASFSITKSITIGSVYPGRQALANWDLAGFTATFAADVVFHNLHIASAEGIKANLVGMTMRFQTCKLVLLDGHFDADSVLNGLMSFQMEECQVLGDTINTEFRIGGAGKTTIELRDTEFRDIPTVLHATFGTGAIRAFGVFFFNNDVGNFPSLTVGGTGPKFFESCRFYGKNNSAAAAVGVVHVEAALDDLRISASQIRANKGADDGYGIVFQADNITNVVIANTWAQDSGPVTSMLYAAPAGIVIRGPNSTFDGAAFVNVVVAP